MRLLRHSAHPMRDFLCGRRLWAVVSSSCSASAIITKTPAPSRCRDQAVWHHSHALQVLKIEGVHECLPMLRRSLSHGATRRFQCRRSQCRGHETVAEGTAATQYLHFRHHVVFKGHTAHSYIQSRGRCYTAVGGMQRRSQKQLTADLF